MKAPASVSHHVTLRVAVYVDEVYAEDEQCRPLYFHTALSGNRNKCPERN